MNRAPDRLYELLPVVYRMRDAEQNFPLRALLRVINEQASVVEDDLERSYNNWFIETCDDWVVPYIADLIGYRPVHDGGDPGESATLEGRRRNRILVPRREVANTLGYRRRKGTLALLELLARDTAGWPARAVEFYTLLGWTQHINHLRPGRARTVDLRDGDALDLIDGPFERTAHEVEVRRVISHRTQGRYNIPSVGVFVWRLKSYSVTQAPAYCLESEAPNCFTFSALGHNTPLYNRPEPEVEPTHIAEELNLPVPIRRRALEERIARRPLKTRASADYYGKGKSLVIYAPDWPVKGAPQPITRDDVIPADLSLWRYRAQRNQVAVDPVLGRIVFPVQQLPRRGVWVTYHYGFSADMGLCSSIGCARSTPAVHGTKTHSKRYGRLSRNGARTSTAWRRPNPLARKKGSSGPPKKRSFALPLSKCRTARSTASRLRSNWKPARACRCARRLGSGP